MRVLVIAQTFPYPPDTGSRNVILHWLRALSESHEVELLSVDPTGEGLEAIPGLPRVRVTNAGECPGMTFGKRIGRLVDSIRKGIPSACLAGLSPRALDVVGRIRDSGRYDAVVLPENASAAYARLFAGAVPVLLYKHSVHAVDAREERHRRGALHPRWLLEEWIVRRFEAETCRAATLVCTVNAEDAKQIEQRYRGTGPVQVIPIGVDLGVFPPRSRDPGGHVIGFVGNLAWSANKDAVLWFAKRVLPKVCDSLPDATFRVIGPGGDDLRKEITDPRVVFAGRVPNVAVELESVAAGVIPVISGTGVRFKLIEFLSVGLPTVTTSLGLLGTGALHGEHVLVADDPEAFARAVVTLLSDGELRARLSASGRTIASKLSWDTISVAIRQAVAEVAELPVCKHSEKT